MDVQDTVQNAEKFPVQVLNRGKHGIERSFTFQLVPSQKVNDNY